MKFKISEECPHLHPELLLLNVLRNPTIRPPLRNISRVSFDLLRQEE